MDIVPSLSGLSLLFGISGGEILILLLLVLILFGPSKIPEIARMLGRGINEVKKVQREINTEIHRYSSEIEKETSKMQSEINDIKKQVAKSVDDREPVETTDAKAEAAEKRRREPRPDPYEEALANDPGSPEQERADAIRENLRDPGAAGGPDQPPAGEQDEPLAGAKEEPLPGDEDQQPFGEDDLPYPYNRKGNRDSVD